MKTITMVAAGLLLLASPAASQERARPGARQVPQAGAHMPPQAGPQQDPIGQWLFAPDLIMRHNRELDLSADQRERVMGAIQALQSEMVDHQWQLMEAVQALETILREPRVDENAAQAAMTRLTDIEARVKRTHLTALVRIKNTLTREQQQRLDELRRNPPDAQTPVGADASPPTGLHTGEQRGPEADRDAAAAASPAADANPATYGDAAAGAPAAIAAGNPDANVAAEAAAGADPAASPAGTLNARTDSFGDAR